MENDSLQNNVNAACNDKSVGLYVKKLLRDLSKEVEKWEDLSQGCTLFKCESDKEVEFLNSELDKAKAEIQSLKANLEIHR